MIKAVLFDFGGVLAEEGFREGLRAVAGEHGLDPDSFLSAAREIVYSSGYVTGKTDEHSYWEAVRRKTGISDDDESLRNEILRRFILRERVLELVRQVRSSGLTTAILSDQTNWLDELEGKKPFYGEFDFVFNSFKLGKSKKDPSVFEDVCAVMEIEPSEALFIDDSYGNVTNAEKAGMKAVLFRDLPGLERTIRALLASSAGKEDAGE